MRLTVAAARKQIKADRLDPVYVLLGADEIEKAALANELAESVEEELRGFNVQRFYGGETTITEVIDAARTLAFGAGRRVVLLLHAERLLEPKRESEAAERALSAFEEYVRSPVADSTLVIVASALDRRTRVWRVLGNAATVVECGALESRSDAERWIRTRIEEAGRQIEPAAVKILAGRAGTDLMRLRADLERLLLFAGDRDRIQQSDVLEVIGPAVSQDDWAVTNAIEARQVRVALKEMALALDAGIPPLKILGQLGWFVRTRMAPGRVPEAVEALFRTDQDLKASAGDPRVLLERLVVELCKVGSEQAR